MNRADTNRNPAVPPEHLAEAGVWIARLHGDRRDLQLEAGFREWLRADPSLANIPFIMVTAESKTDNVIAAKNAGVSNYIVKPFNAQTLKNKIDAVFGAADAAAPAA